MNDFDDIKNRLDEINRKRAALEGKKQAIFNERKRVLAQTKKSQERIEISDMVREVLDRLQKKEQERAVGAYEELLGAFLGDVLPGERQVVMDLHTERGGPALDVYVKKGKNAPLEDWLGTGGSVTNLLSTGLRLIALLRSGQRRFLILDESDCWLKPDLIPKYASIVKQMSKELKIQILMISHHDESLFSSQIPHRLKLEKQGSVLSALWSPTSQIPQWNDTEKGIRSLTLKNFQAHQNTIIPLSNEVTLLQGDNDMGKSSIVNAIRAVFDGEVNDKAIKHHEISAQVMIDFGPENLLVWERWRKGKVKTSYKLINPNNGETIYHNDGTKVPDWIKDEIKIGRVDGLDIQIGQQKEPVFLLNQPPSFRAKALAIGQESNYINTMMSHDKQEINEARAKFKEGEKELERLRRYLMVFERLDEEKMDENLGDKLKALLDRNEKTKDMMNILFNWNYQFKIIKISDGKIKNINFPTIKSTYLMDDLKTWKRQIDVCDIIKDISYAKDIQVPKQNYIEVENELKKWNYFDKYLNVFTLNEIDLSEKSMTDKIQKISSINENIEQIIQVNNNWQKTIEKMNILNHLQSLPTINNKTHLNDLNEVKEILDKWLNENDNYKKMQADINKIEKEKNELDEIIKTTNPTCPTCHKKLDEHDFHKMLANH